MVVVAIHIKVETKALLKATFAFIFGFGQTLEMTGIDARVNKPMLFFQIVICCNMCVVQKMTSTGGAGKVVMYFCLYYE